MLRCPRPKKYQLFVSISDKVDGLSSFRSSKESVKDNQLAKFGDEDLEFFGDDKVHGWDSCEENCDGERSIMMILLRIARNSMIGMLAYLHGKDYIMI